MNEMVYTGNGGKPLTDSLRVAEKFEKRHCDLIKAIKNMTTQNCVVQNMFVESTYINEQNKEQPMFIMNRDGFTFLVMGFTGKKGGLV